MLLLGYPRVVLEVNRPLQVLGQPRAELKDDAQGLEPHVHLGPRLSLQSEVTLVALDDEAVRLGVFARLPPLDDHVAEFSQIHVLIWAGRRFGVAELHPIDVEAADLLLKPGAKQSLSRLLVEVADDDFAAAEREADLARLEQELDYLRTIYFLQFLQFFAIAI